MKKKLTSKTNPGADSNLPPGKSPPVQLPLHGWVPEKNQTNFQELDDASRKLAQPAEATLAASNWDKTQSALTLAALPKIVRDAVAYKRGRPSKIFSAARARLLGPPDRALPITLVQTRNYDQFIIPIGVVEPLPAEVEAFVQRLDFRNELTWNPLRVTPYLEVYDGKLRLAAARLLGYPVTYLVDENLSVGDIVADRGEPRGWELDQYCLYYAEQGRPQYQRLLEFADRYDFPLGAAASLLGGGGAKPTKEALWDFKRGKFRITHATHAARVVAIRDEYRAKFPNPTPDGARAKAFTREDVTVQRVFLNAVSKQLAKPGVQREDLSSILGKIIWQPTEADYDRHIARLLRDQAQGNQHRLNVN